MQIFICQPLPEGMADFAQALKDMFSTRCEQCQAMFLKTIDSARSMALDQLHKVSTFRVVEELASIKELGNVDVATQNQMLGHVAL